MDFEGEIEIHDKRQAYAVCLSVADAKAMAESLIVCDGNEPTDPGAFTASGDIHAKDAGGGNIRITLNRGGAVNAYGQKAFCEWLGKHIRYQDHTRKAYRIQEIENTIGRLQAELKQLKLCSQEEK